MSRPATERLKINPPLGRPATLEWVSVDDLLVDKTYQRTLENKTAQALIRRIAQFWDWALCQPVNVARRADGSLWIVDGQHRHAAAALREDIPHLPCVITSYTDRGEEAAAFVALNKQRRALGAVDVFKASLAAGDEDSRVIMDLIESAGLTLASHSNYTAWKPGMLYCVPTIAAAYRKHGKIITSSALCALSEAFSGQVLQFAANLLEGLFPFYAEELREEAFDADIFIDELGAHGQSEWVRLARVHIGKHEVNRKTAMHAVLTDAYLGALQESIAA